jgi:hypothetical protein
MTMREAMQRYPELPRLARREVEELWFGDWHDGPLDGMLCWLGKHYWYKFLGAEGRKDNNGWFRYVGVVLLSEEEIAYETYWQEQFVVRVQKGTPEQFKSFYDAYKPKIYLDHPVVAWFDIFEPGESRASVTETLKQDGQTALAKTMEQAK